MNTVHYISTHIDLIISPETMELRRELTEFHEQHAELLTRFDALTTQLKQKNIETFEELAIHDQQAKKILVQLAQETKSVKMEGINIALFGLTSTGKSTMINALLGKRVAETGAGETTTKITPYNGIGFTLWDIPGRNDELSYLSMEYIAFFKGLTQRLILIQATVKENLSLMKFLDEIGLHYDIVFNKFDICEEEEQAALKQQIQSEVKYIGLKGVNKIYFLSAKWPKMFVDWLIMVDDITKQSRRIYSMKSRILFLKNSILVLLRKRFLKGRSFGRPAMISQTLSDLLGLANAYEIAKAVFPYTALMTHFYVRILLQQYSYKDEFRKVRTTS